MVEKIEGDDFLGSVATMVSTPLSALRDLLVQIPAAGALNEQQSYLLGQALKSNSELALLVNDLFAVEQLRREPLDPNRLVELDTLVAATIETQRSEFERRGQILSAHILPCLPPVVGDEERLGRAFSALLDNAAKYNPSGSSITVTVTQRGRFIVVGVQDSGIGLQPDEVERVFEPFYRAQSTRQLGVAGRGLGLAIARAVIEGHGGQIRALSTPGSGCLFVMRVPCESSLEA